MGDRISAQPLRLTRDAAQTAGAAASRQSGPCRACASCHWQASQQPATAAAPLCSASPASRPRCGCPSPCTAEPPRQSAARSGAGSPAAGWRVARTAQPAQQQGREIIGLGHSTIQEQHLVQSRRLKTLRDSSSYVSVRSRVVFYAVCIGGFLMAAAALPSSRKPLPGLKTAVQGGWSGFHLRLGQVQGLANGRQGARSQRHPAVQVNMTLLLGRVAGPGEVVQACGQPAPSVLTENPNH